MIGRSPEDNLAELTEGLCHCLPGCLLHPPKQCWFLIRYRQVHKEVTDSSNQSSPSEPRLWGCSPQEAPCCPHCSQASPETILCVIHCVQMCNSIPGIPNQKDRWVKVWAFSCRICSSRLKLSWTVARQTLLSMGFPSKHTGGGRPSLLQGIFLTQGSSLLCCSQILYRLSHQAVTGMAWQLLCGPKAICCRAFITELSHLLPNKDRLLKTLPPCSLLSSW